MHILYIHQYFCPPGGYGNNRSYELAKAWVAAGHEVTMLTTAAYFAVGYPPKGNFVQDGIRVHLVGTSYKHSMGYGRRSLAFALFGLLALLKGLRLGKPQLIYASSPPLTAPLAGWLLAGWHRVPYVYEAVDVWPDVPQGMGLIRNKLLLWVLHGITNLLYRRASAVVALSPAMCQQVISHGIPPQRVHLSLNGTNTAVFVPMAQSLNSPTVQLVVAGAMGPANGLEALLQALVLLKRMELPPWHCRLIGWGKQLPQLKLLQTQLGLSQQVSFHPPLPKEALPAALAQAQVGICTFAPYPVLQANSANKFYDYLAMGLPVVINYQGWQANVLAQAQAGLSSPMGNVPLFAENLALLIQNHPLRKQMGNNARQLALRYDRQAIAAELLLLMEGTIKKRVP